MKKIFLYLWVCILAGELFAAAPGTWFLRQITDAQTGDTFYIAMSSDVIMGKQIDPMTGDTYYVATTTSAWPVTAYNSERLGGLPATNYALISNISLYKKDGQAEVVKQYFGTEDILTNSTATVVLVGLAGRTIQSVPIISTRGNYSDNVFVFDIWNSSFTIRNVGNDTVKTGWRVITK